MRCTFPSIDFVWTTLYTGLMDMRCGLTAVAQSGTQESCRRDPGASDWIASRTNISDAQPAAVMEACRIVMFNEISLPLHPIWIGFRANDVDLFCDRCKGHPPSKLLHHVAWRMCLVFMRHFQYKFHLIAPDVVQVLLIAFV